MKWIEIMERARWVSFGGPSAWGLKTRENEKFEFCPHCAAGHTSIFTVQFCGEEILDHKLGHWSLPAHIDEKNGFIGLCVRQIVEELFEKGDELHRVREIVCPEC